MMLRVFYFMEKYVLHKLSRSREYQIWCDVKQRCSNIKNRSYKNYGGRGITVCDEWKESFLNFYRDMGPRPSKNHSIDRIDNEKGYFKENCRWASHTTQSNNKRIQKRNISGCKGVRWRKERQKWESKITVNKTVFYLGLFSDLKDAIEERKKAELKYRIV